MAPRSSFVMLTLLACALGAAVGIMLPARTAIELRPQNVLRLSGGMPGLVLMEKSGSRRAPGPPGRAPAPPLQRSPRPGASPGPAAPAGGEPGGRGLRAATDGEAPPGLPP